MNIILIISVCFVCLIGCSDSVANHYDNCKNSCTMTTNSTFNSKEITLIEGCFEKCTNSTQEN